MRIRGPSKLDKQYIPLVSSSGPSRLTTHRYKIEVSNTAEASWLLHCPVCRKLWRRLAAQPPPENAPWARPLMPALLKQRESVAEAPPQADSRACRGSRQKTEPQRARPLFFINIAYLPKPLTVVFGSRASYLTCSLSWAKLPGAEQELVKWLRQHGEVQLSSQALSLSLKDQRFKR